jgi:hypothetical protein
MSANTNSDKITIPKYEFDNLERLIALRNFDMGLTMFRGYILDEESADAVIVQKLLNYYTKPLVHIFQIDEGSLDYCRSNTYEYNEFPILVHTQRAFKQEFLINTISIQAIEMQDFRDFPIQNNLHIVLFYKRDQYIYNSLLSDICKLNYNLKQPIHN